MRNKFFSQYELEFNVGQQLEYGDDTKLAERLGVGPGMVSQYMNSGDGRESPIYKAACMFAEWIDLNPEAGCKALEIFNYYVERAKPKNGSLCVDKTREAAFRESSEFQLASVTKSTDEIKRELIDSIHASERHLEAIEAKEQKERRSEIVERATARLNVGLRKVAK